jgi:hypothetical protein
MSSEPDRMSDANVEALSSMLSAHIARSAAFARAHLNLTQPDRSWESLSPDEQAEAILAAHPWFVVARALFMGGCPACGVVDKTPAGEGQVKCAYCGHQWTPEPD